MAGSLETLSPVLNESVSAVTATPSIQVGTLRTDSSGNQYIYAYNAGNSQISVGQLAVLSAVSGYSVTVSSTTTVDFAIGMVKHATMTTATYGWLLQKGFATISADANNSFTSGDLIAIASAGNMAIKSSATGFTGPVIGKCMTSVASGTVGGFGFFKFV